MSWKQYLDLRDVISGTAANVLASVVIAVLAFVLLDQKKTLRPWLAKYVRPAVKKYYRHLRVLFGLIVHPYMRIALLALLLIRITVAGTTIWYSALIFLVAISLLKRPERATGDLPAPLFSDDFDEEQFNHGNWVIKTGSPIIESDFGKPQPDLLLQAYQSEATNSFILLKGFSVERGIIECDFYLEPGAVFNIVFLCDERNDNWFMARYDSRERDSDGFLIKDGGPGANWRYHKISGTQTSVKSWHRARIEFNSEKAVMFKDGEYLLELASPQQFGRTVGFYNERAHVHFDNFSLIKS